MIQFKYTLEYIIIGIYIFLLYYLLFTYKKIIPVGPINEKQTLPELYFFNQISTVPDPKKQYYCPINYFSSNIFFSSI